MLRIYPVVLEVLRALRPLLLQLQKRDSDLARQMRRASASVALNLAEGMYSRGGNRLVRYHSALGSMRETTACIEVGIALGYIECADDELMGRIDHVTGTLVRLVK